MSRSDSGLASGLQIILLPIQVKRLSLYLDYRQFIASLTLPGVLSRLPEFELNVWFHFDDVDVNTNDPHPLIPRLRSATFPLRWFQTRSLELD